MNRVGPTRGELAGQMEWFLEGIFVASCSKTTRLQVVLAKPLMTSNHKSLTNFASSLHKTLQNDFKQLYTPSPTHLGQTIIPPLAYFRYKQEKKRERKQEQDQAKAKISFLFSFVSSRPNTSNATKNQNQLQIKIKARQ